MEPIFHWRLGLQLLMQVAQTTRLLTILSETQDLVMTQIRHHHQALKAQQVDGHPLVLRLK